MVAVWGNDGTFEMLREVSVPEGNEESNDDVDEDEDSGHDDSS